MVVKRSSKNQVAIPKAVLERAGLGPNDVYFDVLCEGGRIVLIPLALEEKISDQALKHFEEKTLQQEKEDKTYASVVEALKGLRRKLRK